MKNNYNLPLVSIVVLNFNGLKYLKKTFPTVLNLDYKKYEIILVDNNSSDNSVKWIKKAVANSLRSIRILENEKNYGYSKGKNIGAGLAKGEFIWLLDNDIKLTPDSLKKLVASYYKLERPGILMPLLKDFGRDFYFGGYFNCYGTTNRLKRKDIVARDILETPYVSGGVMFFKKSVWQELGGFDESENFNLDDFDLSIRSYLMGFKNYLIADARVWHVGNLTNNIVFKYQSYFSGRSRSLFKNLTLDHLIIIYPLFVIASFLFMCRDTIKYQKPGLIFIYFSSIVKLLKNLPDVLQARKKVQLKRAIESDIFFNQHL